MIKKTLAITLLASTCNSGCTMIQDRLTSQNITTKSTKEMIYNFITPRRNPLPAATNANLNKTSTREHTYYSASGYECRVISIAGSPRSMCLVDGSWQEAAPIFNTQTY